MKEIFDQLSRDMSKMTTKRYSTSFSIGIRFLHNDLRDPIYSVYGFVRFADEIVDSFDGHNKSYLLDKFTTPHSIHQFSILCLWLRFEKLGFHLFQGCLL